MCCTSSPIGGIFMACSQPGELLFGCSDVSSCYVACLAFVRGCVIASRNLSKPGRGLPSTKATLAAAPLGTRAKEVAKGRSAVGDTAGSGRSVDRRELPRRRDRTPPGLRTRSAAIALLATFFKAVRTALLNGTWICVKARRASVASSLAETAEESVTGPKPSLVRSRPRCASPFRTRSRRAIDLHAGGGWEAALAGFRGRGPHRMGRRPGPDAAARGTVVCAGGGVGNLRSLRSIRNGAASGCSAFSAICWIGLLPPQTREAPRGRDRKGGPRGGSVPAGLGA